MNTPLSQPEIPPSLDQHGERKWIIPAEVKGRFRRLRDVTQWGLLAFFLLSPWIYIGGEQALFFNIAKKEFHFFGLSLYAHDAPLIFFFIAIAAFGLIFVTTVWGRAFCGWACPQTVFIDGVFRKIEIAIEGKYLVRRKMAQSPMTAEIFYKKSIKWILFVMVSSLIAHSFVAFFVGSRELVQMMQNNPQDNWSYFVLITAMTLLILFDFAWFREQFCLIVCPYGRFQSVLLGRRTLNVAYDVNRGEPRKGLQPKVDGNTGDCVNCRRCVEVCPTGIDIRQGLQLECIACTACIDACDEIMEKVKKPKGLIRYMNTLNTSEWTIRSPRAIFSLIVVSLSTIALTVLLAARNELDVSVLRGKDALYQRIEENGLENLTNHFRLHIKNQTKTPMSVSMEASTESSPLVLISPENPLKLTSQEHREIHVFIKFSPALLKEGQVSATLKFKKEGSDTAITSKSVHLVGPKAAQ